MTIYTDAQDKNPKSKSGSNVNSDAASHFTGNTSVKMYTDAKNGLECSVGSVSFEPGARTNWHSHGGGQILLITEGTAFYQEKGKPKQILHKGDLVTSLPGAEHWHGATPDSRMTHTAIGPNADKGTVIWLGKVDDDIYLSGQTQIAGKQFLTRRQQSITAIAALTAKGNLPALESELTKGLEAGLTVNEIKEILVQLYAYCGFPRSLNAINTLNTLMEERKAKNINDPVGDEPVVLSSNVNKYELGKKNLETLTGKPETGPKTGYAAFVPVIELFLKEHLFADIFSRGVLSNQDRELVTISALSSLGGVEAQLQSHMGLSMNTGLTRDQVSHMLDVVADVASTADADAGRKVLEKLKAG
ncbi:carboxymuconolactone decarboxylase family protein [Pedobacter sp.]|uniref:cupin domain-containing carboxymuconolactone decarboxylase family protein n=1 Tax=Pedobacter sp. TaxID=1411316 RepID=UPI003396DCB9